jgi:hypothetical protein
MAVYRLYWMNSASGHIERVENITARDDVEAMEIGRGLSGEQPLELWCDGRKVYRFETSTMERYRTDKIAKEIEDDDGDK